MNNIGKVGIARRLAERVLRDRTLKRRLPADFSSLPIRVSSAGGLKLLLKPMSQVDPDLFSTVKALVRPGNTVWDIGANVGLFSYASAAIAGSNGRVVAFEPDTKLVDLLRQNARMLPATAAPLTVVPVGVAGETALRTFVIADRARASNTLSEYGNSQMGGARETQTIACISADHCLAWLPAPDVIKIDVEGAEIEVLTGARRLMSAHSPTIACEVAPQNATAVTDLFRSAGYSLFDASKPLRRDAEIETAAWNTIAVPANKLGELP